MKNIKTIIFDLGVVLIDILTEEQWSETYVKPLIGSPISDFHQECHDFEMGILTREELYKIFIDKSGRDFSIDEFQNCWNKRLLEIPLERIELLQRLKSSYQLYLLSNTNQMHIDHILKYVNDKFGHPVFDEVFEQCFYSHELSTAKPQAEIYNKVHELIGNHSKDSCLFVDDSPQNIATAKDYGWHGIIVDREIIDLFTELGL